jgi:hypothetical protein
MSLGEIPATAAVLAAYSCRADDHIATSRWP